LDYQYTLKTSLALLHLRSDITAYLDVRNRQILQLLRNTISKPINRAPIPIIPQPKPKATPPTPHQPTEILLSPIFLLQPMALRTMSYSIFFLISSASCIALPQVLSAPAFAQLTLIAHTGICFAVSATAFEMTHLLASLI
jgi:hypothetical protein